MPNRLSLLIALDFDGVICDSPRNLFKWHNDTFGTDLVYEKDFIDVQLHRSPGWGTREVIHSKFSPNTRMEILSASLPLPGTKEALQSFVDAGHKLIIITARTKEAKPYIEAWLKKHDLAQYITEIHAVTAGSDFVKERAIVATMAADDNVGQGKYEEELKAHVDATHLAISKAKVDLMHKLNAVIFVDDQFDNVDAAVLSGIPSILFGNMPHNQVRITRDWEGYDLCYDECIAKGIQRPVSRGDAVELMKGSVRAKDWVDAVSIVETFNETRTLQSSKSEPVESLPARKNLLLAIDFDNVLAFTLDAFVRWHNETYNTDMTLEENHGSLKFFRNKYWGSKEEVNHKTTAAHLGRDFIATIEPAQGLQQAIMALRAKGHRMVVITARSKAALPNIEKWLKRLDIFYCFEKLYSIDDAPVVTGIVCSPAPGTEAQIVDAGAKVALMKYLGASILVDDAIANCEVATNAGIFAILFGPWQNQWKIPKDWSGYDMSYDERIRAGVEDYEKVEFVLEGGERAKDWKEVLEVVERFEKGRE